MSLPLDLSLPRVVVSFSHFNIVHPLYPALLIDKKARYPVHGADDQGTEYSGPETLNHKSRYHSRGHHQQHRIDNERKEPKGQQIKGQRQNKQDGAEKCVQYAENGCGKQGAEKAAHPNASPIEAIRGVNKAVPYARERFIEKQTQAAHQEPEPASDGPSYSVEEVATYPDQIERYQLEHKCKCSEALKALDVLKPGLRRLYIEHVNK